LDPATGAGASLGGLVNQATGRNQRSVQDLTLVGRTLYGPAWNDDQGLYAIDTATGKMTEVGGIEMSYGNALAADETGTIYSAPEGSGGTLYKIDTRKFDTNARFGSAPALLLEEVAFMDGSLGTINSMAFLNGTLY